MTIANAVSVNGWMLSTELEWLSANAKKRKNIVEIGSWMGRSTRCLADSTSGRVTAVDTWKGSEEAEHLSLLKGKPEGWLFNEFSKNLADHIKSWKVLPVVGSSIAVAAEYRVTGKQFDMIFIDADHRYEAVKADLEAWFPLLAPGGLICGHDFNKAFLGVTQAVTEFFPGEGRVKKMDGGSIWFV